MSIVTMTSPPPRPGSVLKPPSGYYTVAAELNGIAVRFERTVSTSISADVIYSYFFPIYEDVVVTSLGIDIVANAGGSGTKKYAMGIYTCESSLPKSLLGSTGGISVAAGTTGLSETAVSIVLHPGHYFISFVSDTARNASNWELDMHQNSSSSYTPSASIGRSTGAVTTSSFSNGMVSQAYTWSDGTPLPATTTSPAWGNALSPSLTLLMKF